MDETTTDFVIVGGGQTQLSCAAYLAAAGHGVTVLEQHEYCGGGCISKPVTAPDYLHDTHATNVFMAQANPLVRLDELGLVSKFGLRFADMGEVPSHGTVFDDGSALAMYTDIEQSCASIARYSSEDASAYRDFARAVVRYIPLFTLALFSPPAPGDRFKALLAESEQGRFLLDFFTASTAQVIEKNFRHERTRVHLLRLASEMMMRADAPGGAFGLMFMLGLYHTYKTGFVVGGSQQFSDSLVRCIRHHGGQVVNGARVAKVEVEAGRAVAVRTGDGRRFAAKQAVIAGLVPWRLSEYVAGTEALTEKVRSVPTSDYTCLLLHLGLRERPRVRAADEFQRMGFTTLAPMDFSAMVRMSIDAAEGRVPDDFSATYVCASDYDHSRAPPGGATLYLYRTVPTKLAGQLENWEAQRESVAQGLLDGARRYVSNLDDSNIVGRHAESPLDYQRESPSFRNGDVASLAMTPDQFFNGRPIPELANYRVPGIERLYLCGPFMHPGGGANGGGRPAAMRVMMDLEMDLSKVFVY